MPGLRSLYLSALVASAFIGESLADCPAVGSNFYITAKLRGGQNGYYGYADQYGPYFSFTENIEDGDQFYLDTKGHLHDAKQAPNALAQTIGSVDRVNPPFAVSFYQLLSGDAPVVCAFQPQANGGCNLGCSVTVTDGDGTDTLTDMYTCFGCDAKRHRCVNFDFNPPTEPDSMDLRCKPVRLGVQIV